MNDSLWGLILYAGAAVNLILVFFARSYDAKTFHMVSAWALMWMAETQRKG